MSIPVSAVFDLGKTNKKFYLFDHNFHQVFEETMQSEYIRDDDNVPCEDIVGLTTWMQQTFDQALNLQDFEIQSLNFSTYGASFVHTDNQGSPVAPLYDYLKPFPEWLEKSFFEKYGSKKQFALETASPIMGMLNSGLQLYHLRHHKPQYFEQTAYSLHLPQYCSSLFTKQMVSEKTSIGCHTGMWHYENNNYHRWLHEENILPKLPGIVPSDSTYTKHFKGQDIQVGVGLHDSSASLIPYLEAMQEPFMLLSTGTWNISLNPFCEDPLTENLLEKDCLNFLSYKGNTVRAARLFLGNEHQHQVEKLEKHFNKQKGAFKQVKFDETYLREVVNHHPPTIALSDALKNTQALLPDYDYSHFPDFEYGYHRLIYDLVQLQVQSLSLAQGSTPIKKLIVTGGFCNNALFLKMLAAMYSDMEVFTSNLNQATAIGSALITRQAEYRNQTIIDFKHVEPAHELTPKFLSNG